MSMEDQPSRLSWYQTAFSAFDSVRWMIRNFIKTDVLYIRVLFLFLLLYVVIVKQTKHQNYERFRGGDEAGTWLFLY